MHEHGFDVDTCIFFCFVAFPQLRAVFQPETTSPIRSLLELVLVLGDHGR